jgi:hypothetical protein
MKIYRISRFIFAGLLFTVTWIALSSTALADGTYPSAATGNDISFPQCGTSSYPSNTFGIVGVGGGRAFTHNPCLAQEFTWAQGLSTRASLYMNLNAPADSTASNGMTGAYGHCSQKNKRCQAKNYGYNAAQDAFNYATSQNVSSSLWWLDIETANFWASETSLNQATIKGAVRFLSSQGISVGVYSTQSMWSSITGGYTNGLPAWVAIDTTNPSDYCSSTYAFTGGAVYLVQYSYNDFDTDYAC